MTSSLVTTYTKDTITYYVKVSGDPSQSQIKFQPQMASQSSQLKSQLMQFSDDSSILKRIFKIFFAIRAGANPYSCRL